MKNWKLTSITLGILALTTAAAPVLADEHSQPGAEELQQRIAENRQAIQQFASSLQGELVAAMENGGPTEAIQVCNERAPLIAAEISQKTGIDLGRTSLKLRNPDNAPDAWERLVLQGFDAQKTAGTPAGELPPRYQIVETEDGARFRFMAAIPTGAVCLTCHGGDVSNDVQHALERLYPEDRATGYREGDVRGAFTLSQEM